MKKKYAKRGKGLIMAMVGVSDEMGCPLAALDELGRRKIPWFFSSDNGELQASNGILAVVVTWSEGGSGAPDCLARRGGTGSTCTEAVTALIFIPFLEALTGSHWVKWMGPAWFLCLSKGKFA